MEPSQNHTAGFRQWAVPILLRSIVFFGCGALIFFVCGMYADAVGEKIFDSDGEASVVGRSFVFLLFVASEMVAILAAVSATNFCEGKPGFGLQRGSAGALGIGHKLLLLSLCGQFLILPLSGNGYLLSFFAIGFSVYLVALGLGYTTRGQVIWICLAVLPTFSAWLGAVLPYRATETNIVVFYLPILLVIGELIIVYLLSRRTSRALHSVGLKMKFFGVPFVEIPSLFTIEASVSTQAAGSAPGEWDTRPTSHQESSATGADSKLNFYYLGPNEEPIGPISSDVLLQLRESSIVTDVTLVAPAGETQWKPLRSFLEVTEEESV
jgi:hypothetical protein